MRLGYVLASLRHLRCMQNTVTEQLAWSIRSRSEPAANRPWPSGSRAWVWSSRRCSWSPCWRRSIKRSSRRHSRRIVSDVGGVQHLSWVVTAYVLASTATPFYGKLSDLYGRKPVHADRELIFLIGSMLAGFA